MSGSFAKAVSNWVLFVMRIGSFARLETSGSSKTDTVYIGVSGDCHCAHSCSVARDYF